MRVRSRYTGRRCRQLCTPCQGTGSKRPRLVSETRHWLAMASLCGAVDCGERSSHFTFCCDIPGSSRGLCTSMSESSSTPKPSWYGARMAVKASTERSRRNHTNYTECFTRNRGALHTRSNTRSEATGVWETDLSPYGKLKTKRSGTKSGIGDQVEESADWWRHSLVLDGCT